MPELALRLIAERVPGRMVDDPYRGRHFERLKHPALTDLERSALMQAAAILQAMLGPGSRREIVAALARLANHRIREKSQQEWQMLFEDYADDLAEFSASHVQEAIKEHRRSNPFFPASAELRKRCLELVDRDKFRLERCERVLANG